MTRTMFVSISAASSARFLVCIFDITSTMPKKAMKSMKAPFPDAKRGKRCVQRRPAGKKYKVVPHVRHGTPTAKNKEHRVRWGRSIHQWMSLSKSKLIRALYKDNILTSWKGRKCPRCGSGTLGALQYIKNTKIWAHIATTAPATSSSAFQSKIIAMQMEFECLFRLLI